MKEKELKKETKENNTKLTWEAPRLYCLDKGKTESGDLKDTAVEDVFYYTAS